MSPLYNMLSLHLISSLNYQYDWILGGQSLNVWGHPSWTIFANRLSTGSLDGASHISCSLSGLAGAICVMWCTGIDLFYVVQTGVPVLWLWFQWCHSHESASAMMHFPCPWDILCAHHIVLVWITVSAVLDWMLLSVFFHMLVRGWWSVSTVIDFPNV